MRYPTLYARLVAHVAVPEDQNESGCWQWQAHVDRYGYGRLNVYRDGKATKMHAHRVMEQELRTRAAQHAADDAMPGLLLAPTVPAVKLHADRETLDHACYCSCCTNPDHWEAVTRTENTVRQRARASA